MEVWPTGQIPDAPPRYREPVGRPSFNEQTRRSVPCRHSTARQSA